MHFGVSNVQSHVRLNDAVLDVVSCMKDLGVFLTNSCTFNDHVSLIVSRANVSI